jgi:hypothetical protein
MTSASSPLTTSQSLTRTPSLTSIILPAAVIAGSAINCGPMQGEQFEGSCFERWHRSKDYKVGRGLTKT